MQDNLHRKVQEWNRRARQNAEYSKAMQPPPAQAQRGEDESDQPRAGLEEGLDLNGYSNQFSHFSKGLEYADKGDYHRAITEYDAELAIDSSDPIIYEARGSAYVDSGDIDKGLEDYNLAMALSEDSAEAVKALIYRQRGLAYLAKGDFDSAIVDFDEYIFLDSLSPYIYALRAKANEKLREYAEAAHDWETYFKLTDEQQQV